MAERVGFEPAAELPSRRISSAVLIEGSAILFSPLRRNSTMRNDYRTLFQPKTGLAISGFHCLEHLALCRAPGQVRASDVDNIN